MNPLSAIRGLGNLDAQMLAEVQRGASSKLNPSAVADLKGLEPASRPIDMPGAAQGATSSFGAMFSRMVGEVHDKQVAAGDAVRGVMTGNGTSLHQAMIAMEEAGVAFQLMVEVRNKTMEAYQELMRMQI